MSGLQRRVALYGRRKFRWRLWANVSAGPRELSYHGAIQSHRMWRMRIDTLLRGAKRARQLPKARAWRRLLIRPALERL